MHDDLPEQLLELWRWRYRVDPVRADQLQRAERQAARHRRREKEKQAAQPWRAEGDAQSARRWRAEAPQKERSKHNEWPVDRYLRGLARTAPAAERRLVVALLDLRNALGEEAVARTLTKLGIPLPVKRGRPRQEPRAGYRQAARAWLQAPAGAEPKHEHLAAVAGVTPQGFSQWISQNREAWCELIAEEFEPAAEEMGLLAADEPPLFRDFLDGNEVVLQRFDSETGQWIELARAPAISKNIV